MFIGVLLVLTWLVLLLRYPAKALPVSVAAAIGLGLVATWVVWMDNREVKQLARLELRITYAPEQCPADRPLQLTMNNGNDVPLTELRWRIAAYAPGDTGTWPIINTPHHAIAAPVNCRPVPIGKTVYQCLRYDPVIARKPWSFALSDCRVVSPTDPFPSFAQGPRHARCVDYWMFQRHRPRLG